MSLKPYTIKLDGDRCVYVHATNAIEAIDVARDSAIDQFVEQWDKQIEYVVCMEGVDTPDGGMTRLCAVEQNEVRCAHPGCTGPYNCKERGLDLV